MLSTVPAVREYVLVLEPVEVPREERRGDLIERRVVRKDRAEDGLLRLGAMGEIAGGPEGEGGVAASDGIVLRHGRAQ